MEALDEFETGLNLSLITVAAINFIPEVSSMNLLNGTCSKLSMPLHRGSQVQLMLSQNHQTLVGYADYLSPSLFKGML